MASLGIEAIKTWADTGAKPANTPGKAFFDTGVALVTDEAAPGVPSIDTKEGMDLCWAKPKKWRLGQPGRHSISHTIKTASDYS